MYPSVRVRVCAVCAARVCRDMLIFLMVVYTALTLPIVLAYPDADATFQTVWGLELTFDFFFIVDIPINFRTACVASAQTDYTQSTHDLLTVALMHTMWYRYVANAELIVDKRQIVRKYLFKWFAIDLVGSIPWEAIFLVIQAATADDADENTQVQIVTLVKLLKVPKLLRVGRVVKYLEKIEGAANVGRILAIMLLMAVFVHWLSCCWWAAAVHSCLPRALWLLWPLPLVALAVPPAAQPLPLRSAAVRSVFAHRCLTAPTRFLHESRLHAAHACIA